MSDKFLIPNVPLDTQKNNLYFPSSSCFNSSISNCMQHCLDILGLDKTAVGCHLDQQLEDYIYLLSEANTTKTWIKQNLTKLGGVAVLQYSPRVLYGVETYMFNTLMNHLGYKATFLEGTTYDNFCNKMEQTNLPMVIGADFRTICPVQGHMLTAVGFNKIGLQQIIVNDSWGNACTRYTDGSKSCREVAYALRFFQVYGKGLNAVCIEKI